MALIWHGNKVSKKIQSVARNRVKEVCILVENLVKSSMKRGGRTESGELEIGKRPGKIGAFRSLPGEVPRVQTGTLKRSITHELHPVLPIGRVGTNVGYGKTLELGDDTIAPRPFMRPAMQKAEPLVKGIFSKPMVGE